MNIKKSIFLTAAFAFATGSTFAQTAAAAAPAPATPAPAKVDDAAVDRSRISEYEKNKLPIVFVEDQKNKSAKTSNLNFEELTMIDGVINFKLSADDSPVAVYIPINKGGIKVKYRVNDDLKRMRAAYMRGKWEDVVTVGRNVIYPSVVIMDIPENITNVQENLLMFVESLLKAKRYLEAKGLMESLPLSKCTYNVGIAAIEYLRLMIDAKRFDDVNSVMERLNYGGANLDNLDNITDVVHKLRKAGRVADALKWYTKLQSTPGNKNKNEATMWMAYCDVLNNNDISARLFVDNMKSLPKTEKAYSLKCLVNGMLLEKAKQPDDALDAYAEGIVYGDITFDWMPNLMFNIAKLYKAKEKFKTSNEIFEQIMLLYASTEYAAPSKAELVEIKEEPEEGEEVEEEEEE